MSLKHWLKRLESWFVAITYAEAGEHETARKVMADADSSAVAAASRSVPMTAKPSPSH